MRLSKLRSLKIKLQVHKSECCSLFFLLFFFICKNTGLSISAVEILVMNTMPVCCQRKVPEFVLFSTSNFQLKQPFLKRVLKPSTKPNQSKPNQIIIAPQTKGRLYFFPCLVSVGIGSIFFLAGSTVLCFRVRMRKMLTRH